MYVGQVMFIPGIILLNQVIIAYGVASNLDVCVFFHFVQFLWTQK